MFFSNDLYLILARLLNLMQNRDTAACTGYTNACHNSIFSYIKLTYTASSCERCTTTSSAVGIISKDGCTCRHTSNIGSCSVTCGKGIQMAEFECTGNTCGPRIQKVALPCKCGVSF